MTFAPRGFFFINCAVLLLERVLLMNIYHSPAVVSLRRPRSSLCRTVLFEDLGASSDFYFQMLLAEIVLFFLLLYFSS